VELFNCVCSAVPLKETTASTILFVFTVKVCAVVAVPANSIIFRINRKVLNSPLGVITKEHSVVESDINNYHQCSTVTCINFLITVE
jgi:hypothetical protein